MKALASAEHDSQARLMMSLFEALASVRSKNVAKKAFKLMDFAIYEVLDSFDDIPFENNGGTVPGRANSVDSTVESSTCQEVREARSDVREATKALFEFTFGLHIISSLTLETINGLHAKVKAKAVSRCVQSHATADQHSTHRAESDRSVHPISHRPCFGTHDD